ncbi:MULTISPECIES: RNA-guided pseudouridylation complex pseudouridine synthase subunit Cbf5 [Fervidicoccus]|uniref:H/ACA RNA-protein complex component Cbf5p n=2 Tax=Fervidicoccus fontis TaxID=683846 RepID=I0A0H4_FERFK|nr:RNA-guided pseudouridylation complex pseudouridine synthase subunit Cbf5 [Fervidicoccus fontis]AFH42481.1 H/ACA RNA-protein complex component Cbf5p [Fervidicoccus fontis Kam940]
MPYVVHSVKEYVCVMELHDEVNNEELKRVIEMFKGRIYQRPPVRSNVKRRIRIRKIHDIELLERKGNHVLMRIKCDAGTYMRKLCHDIGLLLGVGAHMRELRRTVSGPFTEDHAVRMQELSEAIYLWKNYGNDSALRKMILPVELSTCILPKILVKDSAISSLLYGAPLAKGGVAAYSEDLQTNKIAAVFTSKIELIGIYEILNNPKKNKNGKVVGRPLAVIMERNSYPKNWGKKI